MRSNTRQGRPGYGKCAHRFLDAIRAFPHWSLRIGDPVDINRTLKDESFNGLFIGDIDEPAATLLSRSALPTVVVGSLLTSISTRRTNIVFLHNDDEDIGREGARVADSRLSQRLHARFGGSLFE